MLSVSIALSVSCRSLVYRLEAYSSSSSGAHANTLEGLPFILTMSVFVLGGLSRDTYAYISCAIGG